MPESSENALFAALADGNRRKIIELFHEEDSTLLELQKHFTVSFQALSKHIKILENAGLINKKKDRTFRRLSLNKEALKPVMGWVSYHSDFWQTSYARLEK